MIELKKDINIILMLQNFDSIVLFKRERKLGFYFFCLVVFFFLTLGLILGKHY